MSKEMENEMHDKKLSMYPAVYKVPSGCLK